MDLPVAGPLFEISKVFDELFRVCRSGGRGEDRLECWIRFRLNFSRKFIGGRFGDCQLDLR